MQQSGGFKYGVIALIAVSLVSLVPYFGTFVIAPLVALAHDRRLDLRVLHVVRDVRAVVEGGTDTPTWVARRWVAQNLAVDIALERGDGTLKRLSGTPLPVGSYFVGKFGQVLVTSLLQVALLVLVARVLFGVPLPTDAGSWLTLAWVYLLGIATSALVGIALSRVPRSGKSATAVIVPITLVLQFISGVYLFFYQLPEWLQNFASLFPLKWMAQGMRYVFLPEDYAVLEQNQEWDLSAVAMALGIWLVVGLVLSRMTFRWIRRDA